VLVAATLLVAVVYVYFLIFAQFGFLTGLAQRGGSGETVLRAVLAVMGVSGVAASVVAAWWHRPERGGAGLVTALLVAGLAAALAPFVDSSAGFFVTAALVGIGLGGATVLLAASIRAATGERALGLVLGTGTGLAYGFCNLPAVFHGAPGRQAGIALAAAAVGVIATPMMRRSPCAPAPSSPPRAQAVAVWVAIFLALVWLDSAAFYVIQHNPVLHLATWAETARLSANAALHLGAAVVAGWLLGRGRQSGVILVSAALLAAACMMLSSAPALAASFYVMGVSGYSTTLVFYPAASGRAGVAAVIYAVSGWLGSALGIGMVIDRAGIPPGFPALMLVAVGVALGVGRKVNKS
jgi:cytochrome c oxidase cbb3-type subunit 2